MNTKIETFFRGSEFSNALDTPLIVDELPSMTEYPLDIHLATTLLTLIKVGAKFLTNIDLK